MCGDGTFIGTVLCVSSNHACGCPPAEPGKIGFTATTAEPVIYKVMAQHVGVEVYADLQPAMFDDATDSAVGKGSNATSPQSF
jgi:hypothetical protein